MNTSHVPPNGMGADARKGITRARLRARRTTAELVQGWDDLEDWEREEWWKHARSLRLRVRWKSPLRSYGKPRSRAMRGQELYLKINQVLELCGSERRRLPPPPPKFAPNPVKPELKISLGKDGLVIKLVLKGPLVNGLMVYGSPPRRAGQGPGGNYAFLGMLPPPKNGECDITEMYLRKLREWLRLRSAQYHVPLEGARICIRTWPQDNGWEGKAWTQISHGVVQRLK